jgi:hypothetical protein
LRALRRGSDVAGAVGVQDADGEVAQAGHGAGGGRTAQARQIRIHVGRRSCATARVPQEAQPSTSTIVSTTITSSSVPRPPRAPGTRAVPPARPPGAYRPSPRVSIVDLQTAVTMARPLPRVVDPTTYLRTRRPYSDAKTRYCSRHLTSLLTVGICPGETLVGMAVSR